MSPVRRTFTLPDELFERAERVAEDPSRRYSGLNALLIDALDQFLVDSESTSGGTASPAPSIGTSQTGAPGRTALDALVSGQIERVQSLLSTPVAEMLRRVTETRPTNLADTALRPVGGAKAFEPTERVENGPDEPQFGLHNRDYPSLWSLQLLAEATTKGPVRYSEFAWALNLAGVVFGDAVRQIYESSPEPMAMDPSRMFPKIRDSKKGQWEKFSSQRFTPGEARVLRAPFPNHALGRVQAKRSGAGRGEILARGPLPQWKAIAFETDGRDLLLGPTDRGLELLKSMEGITLDLPHDQKKAEDFLSYLEDTSPADYESFVILSRCVEEEPTRDELVQTFGRALLGQLDLSADQYERQIAGVMQGYVSRAREWGLVEPRLARPGRRYTLTSFGARWRGTMNTSKRND